MTRAYNSAPSPPRPHAGTFTISNLGMFGVSSFVSILPPGQGAIMAVAASTPTAVLQKNGMIGMVKQMTVTLTCAAAPLRYPNQPPQSATSISHFNPPIFAL